jgi:predicted membrane protein
MYDGNVDLYFLGLNRHEWGSIHLWLSFFFLFLLAFHIILHWKMIACIFQRMVPIKLWRIVVAVMIVGISLFLALFFFFIEPKQVLREPRHRNRKDNADLFPQHTIPLIEKMSDTTSKEFNSEKH